MFKKAELDPAGKPSETGEAGLSGLFSSTEFTPSITIETLVRRPLIVGNWKMNKTATEAVTFIRDLGQRVSASPHADVVLAPPFTALESARNALGPPPGSALEHKMSIGKRTGPSPEKCPLRCCANLAAVM